jgi:hypothetical protein
VNKIGHGENFLADVVEECLFAGGPAAEEVVTMWVQVCMVAEWAELVVE